MTSKPVIAIAGNPNSGKTTFFNKYTGARQHVGNYPGITVDRKEGTAEVDGRQVTLVDLPGTYSLTAYSQEEVVARRMLAEERPGAVLDIVNAGVLERNLYLAVQLQEMGIPVALALNMMDEARAKGLSIDLEKLSTLMNLPVVATVARTGEGLNEAMGAALRLAEERAGQPWEPLVISYGPDIDEAINEMTRLITPNGSLSAKYPARWIALKILESDEDILEYCAAADADTCAELTAIADRLALHLKHTLNTYPEALISDHRYGYITSILKQGVLTVTTSQADRIEFSEKIDRVLTHSLFGPLILVGILYSVYYVTFELGEYPAGWIETGFEWLRQLAEGSMADGPLKSLIISGVIDGVSGVFGFVPLIAIMFLFIAVLEDSGYMARVAYMFDRVFRFFGLHGASVMPFIVSGGISGGCAVPGVMATRTLRSPRERLATMLTAPIMACGAKLPVFALLVSVFFTRYQAEVMMAVTITSWLAALLVAKLLRSTVIKGESTPFVMELPPYRFPTFQGLLIHTWERVWQYIKKAGTIILGISILLWAAMTFPGLPEDRAEDYAAQRAPYEERLSALPSSILASRIAELDEKIAVATNDQEQELLEETRATLREELDATPAARLQARLDALGEDLENIGEDPKAEALRERVNELLASLDALGPQSTAAVALQAELAKATRELMARPAGSLLFEIDKLAAELESLPEKQLQGKIDKIANEEAAAALRYSYAGRLGIAIEPASSLAGFDWKTNIALLGGIAAKEVVVSTLGTAYSLGEVDPEEGGGLADRIAVDPNWTMATAVSLIFFTMLYSPCFVTLVAIKQESGSWRWMFFSLFFNLALAYMVSAVAYQLLS